MPTQADIMKNQFIEHVVNTVNQQVADKEDVVELEKFIERYYELVSQEDITALSLAKAVAIALSHWSLVKHRARGNINIHLYNYEENGRNGELSNTIIQITCDDMPFLVDSLRMEINRLAFQVQLVIHFGGLQIVRDEKNHVRSILAIGEYDENAKDDAVIHIEIDKQIDPYVLAAIESNLYRVLHDVQKAVTDWPLMRKRLQQSLLELEQLELPLETNELAETKDFLRWLDGDHFTFLGCRDYTLVGKDEEKALKIVAGSGLGVLADETHSKQLRKYIEMPEEARRQALSKQVLIIAKTNTRATVHRPVYTDYVGIKQFNNQGELIGERRFIGLYTSTAYNTNPKHIPFLRNKVAKVMRMSRLSPHGHAGKTLISILETLPRDDLFQASAEELLDLSLGILQLQERQRVRLFVRKDPYNRFYSCLVYVPRERYNTDMRYAFQTVLQDEFQAQEIIFTAFFTESILAQIHFIIRVDPKSELVVDMDAVQKKIIHASRLWKDDLRDALIAHYEKDAGIAVYQKYHKSFPASYQEYYSAEDAVHDIGHIEKLVGDHALEMDLHIKSSQDNAYVLHFKLFSTFGSAPLSDVLPMLENLGLRVLGERPYKVSLPNDLIVWISEFDMTYVDPGDLDIRVIGHIFKDAFANVWLGNAANDGFNHLVLKAKLPWREIAVLRAFAKYLRQVGFTFSQAYIEAALINNPTVASQLVQIFKMRFNPTERVSAGSVDEMRTNVISALDNVASLDEDRIIRRYLEIIFAILRTNFYQCDDYGKVKKYLAFKLDPEAIPDLPLPKPMYEIFIYSPRMEGLHLRSSKVARGGIRWSNRQEDFRTEVLGLMKAQQVKNAVIVPSGAKGGFIVKQLPASGLREDVLKEVVHCYRTFIFGLLDLTDNVQAGAVVPPENTVRYDDDDTYLVVAADKGTATFSDYANEISENYQFWLSDAFASGGSSGYDHKKMGITARGAWISVRRNFMELGLNTQTTPFTVVGIGDMAGDVFGNGMSQSPYIKLVAAFNHQHIFIDPAPNSKISFKERRRLFNLPRSSWTDYDAALISTGGGVFNRSDKSIKISPEMKMLFDIEQDRLEPNELIHTLLKARVDLIFNGGIGTYVKAETETHLDVGDRANDMLRVNGNELRCRVFGEGGNLGCTQLGRVEYALKGGQIYTDFIDNSAGVDCSDHEVNIKVLLNHIMAEGVLTKKQRNELLAEMTDEIAHLVLRNNYEQTLAVSVATFRSLMDMNIYRRHVNALEAEGKFNRKLEFFADDATLMDRRLTGKGLTKPEVAILFAYTKNLLKQDILSSDVPEDEFFFDRLTAEFPMVLQQKFSKYMPQHSLRREIIATQLTNNVVNRTGVNFVHRLEQETGATAADIVRAYTIASNLFPMEHLLEKITALDHKIDSQVQFELLFDVSLLVRRATRWFVRNRKRFINIQSTIQYFKNPTMELIKHLEEKGSKNSDNKYVAAIENYVEKKVPQELAEKIAVLPALFFALDIVDAVTIYRFPLEKFTYVFFELGKRMEIDWLRLKIREQQPENYWEELSRSLLLDDLDWQQRQLSISIMQFEPRRRSMPQQIDDWFIMNDNLISRWNVLLGLLRTNEAPGLVMFSVVLRELLEFAQYGAKPVRRSDIERSG